MAEEFTLKFTMLSKETKQPVCYKQDGQRFGQAQTLKLNAGTDYDLRFNMKPGRHIKNLIIDGENSKAELATDDEISKDDAVTYRATYSTIDSTGNKNGERKWILLALELEDELHLNFSLQCKLYKPGETQHSQWGQKLTCLSMECKVEKGKDSVVVLREKYV